MNIFWGLKILRILFGVHHKIGLVLRTFLCILGSFLRSIFFGVAKISNIFLGLTIDPGPEPTYEEKHKLSPLGTQYPSQFDMPRDHVRKKKFDPLGTPAPPSPIPGA